MSLRWDVANVHNSEEVCFTDWDHEKQTGNLRPVTETLIFYTMTVKLGSITQKNWKEFFTRVRMYENCFGPVLYKIVGDEKIDTPISAADVRGHIGLHCNVIDETQHRFITDSIVARLKFDVDYAIRTEIEEMENA